MAKQIGVVLFLTAVWNNYIPNIKRHTQFCLSLKSQQPKLVQWFYYDICLEIDSS